MSRTINLARDRKLSDEASFSSLTGGPILPGVPRSRPKETAMHRAGNAVLPIDSILAGSQSAPAPKQALASLSLSVLLSSLATSIANVGLPALAREFAAPLQHVQWIVLAYLLAVTTLVVSAGRLGDLIGRRRLFLAGLSLFTAASLLCGVAPTLWLLVAARAVQGVGAAVIMALSLAFVGDSVPKAAMGRAMGLLGTASAIGTALGPFLGGVLIATMGWRAMFLLIVPVGAITAFLAFRALPPDRREARGDCARFDYAGAILLALTLGAYAIAMTLGSGLFGLLNLLLLLAAFGGVAAFVWAESRSPFPLLRLAMFRDSTLRASLAASALVSTVMMSTLVVAPFYLARGLGLNAALLGFVMAIGPVVAALTGIPAGRMVQRLGARGMTTAGLIGIAAGSLTLSMLPQTAGVSGYIAGIVIITTGYSLFQAANQTAVMAEVRTEQRGVIAGMLNLSRNLGLISGASVMATVFAYAAGISDIASADPATVAHGMRVTFAVASLLIFGALAICLREHSRLAK